MLLLGADVRKKRGCSWAPCGWWRCCMRLSGLSLAAILLFASVMLAQHSSAGGGGGGSSASSGSGGGSHGGSSGGSASSGGGHSSGGSGSHSSGGHSSGSASSHSGVHGSPSHGSHSILGTNRGVNAKTEQPEKRSFFSFLRHPFRKPEPKPEPRTRVVADRQRPICFRGPCPVCLPRHRCGIVPIHRTHNFCSVPEIGRGSACLLPTSFFDDCSGPRRMMEQQAQRMQAAEAAQTACSANAGQDCSGLTTAAQSEGSLYRTLQNRYRRCQQRSLGAFPFPAFGFSSYSAGLMFGSLEMGLDY
jgi:hypothetical protein